MESLLVSAYMQLFINILTSSVKGILSCQWNEIRDGSKIMHWCSNLMQNLYHLFFSQEFEKKNVRMSWKKISNTLRVLAINRQKLKTVKTQMAEVYKITLC